MTLKGGSTTSTSQACAACKYQRRRCTPECPLAPHFRPQHTHVFKNAHKLFGVRNIIRILKQVDPTHSHTAMKTIIYQANMRERFPVHGCLAAIGQLNHDIRQAQDELQAVLSQLTFYKQQQQQEISLSPDGSPESQQLQLGMRMVQPTNAQLTVFQNHDQQLNPASFYHCYNESGDENNNGCYNNINALWGQQIYCNENDDNDNNNNNNALMSLQFQLKSQEETTHDYNKIQPFFDTIDDRQSYIDSKEAYDSSPDSSLKDTTHSLDENELKSAELQINNLESLVNNGRKLIR